MNACQKRALNEGPTQNLEVVCTYPGALDGRQPSTQVTCAMPDSGTAIDIVRQGWLNTPTIEAPGIKSMGFSQSARTLFVIFCAIFAVSAHAGWNLDPQKSSINFISIKKDSVAEVHRFRDVAGALMDSGEFMIDIDLTSVDTGIDIRDQRMQEHLFDVLNFPLATVNGRVASGTLDQMKQDEITPVEVELVVALHGKTVKTKALVNAVKLSADKLWVTSASPIIINASDFQMEPGVDKLKELAALPSISYAVPVVINLLFEKNSTSPAPDVKP